MKRVFPYILIGIVTIAMVVFPESSVSYAKNALELCGRVIVPSLFPFFICSGLLIYSGVSELLSRISAPVMKPLFNVSGCGSAALVLGVLSGYPLGAVCACQLYDAGYLSKSETERLLAFCNNSGPLFILGAVGSAIYSSRTLGLVLYISHIVSALLVGIIFRFYKKDKHSAPKYRITQPRQGFAQVFSQVLSNSVSSIVTILGAVIFFGAVSGIVTSHLPVSGWIKALLTGIFELTGGSVAISRTQLSLTEKLTLSAFVVGFAGISVHLQVAAIVAKYELSLIPYLLGKLLHGLFSAGFTFLYLYLNPVYVSVFNPTPSPGAGFCMGSLYSTVNILFFVVLAVISVIFVYLAGKYKRPVLKGKK